MKGRRKRERKDGMVAGLNAMKMVVLRRRMEIGRYVNGVLVSFSLMVSRTEEDQGERRRAGILHRIVQIESSPKFHRRSNVHEAIASSILAFLASHDSRSAPWPCMN